MKEKELILPDDWEVKEVVGNKIIIKEKEKELPKRKRPRPLFDESQAATFSYSGSHAACRLSSERK